METNNALSRRDLTDLLSISQQSLGCRDVDGLKCLVAALQKVLGFEYVTLAQAKFPDVFDDPQATVDTLDVSYPAGYMDAYLQERLYLSDATVCAFLSNLEPVHWKVVDERCDALYPAARLSFDLGMLDGWTYGTLDTRHMICTQISLGWPQVEKDPRTEPIIQYIIPFLAEVYRRILDKSRHLTIQLTPREREVLQWLKEGKSSWEISMVLRCSRRVVDFHVVNIKKKLNCTNRAQVIATALHAGLIRF